MRISLFVMCAAAFLASGAAADDEDTNGNTPIELSAAQMDQITAGSGFNNAGAIAWFAGTASDVIAGDICCGGRVEGALFHIFGGGGMSLTGGGKSDMVFVPNNQGHSL